MGTVISNGRSGWIYRLDYKKVIVIAFLARFVFAATYDVFVAVSGKDALLPDSVFYSIRGKYVSLLLNGYSMSSFTKDMVPPDAESQRIFMQVIEQERGRFPPYINESNIFIYIVAVIYFIFGYFTFAVRVFNVSLSILSTYLLFKVARKNFGVMTSNLFLLVALFLPTQFIYSITLTRGFISVFIVSLLIWVVYG
jgi:hypothetical protein